MTRTRPVDAAPRRRRDRLAVGALYAGGFLGPFGAGMVTPVLPEIGADFRVSTGTAALSVTAYLLPFAALMLVSGTLGQRWGAARTTRIAYLGYVVVSLVCVLPGPFWLFLLARAGQGVANSFTTPLLLAALGETVPRQRLGRALGLFSSLQAAGQTTAPLVAGLLAAASWRYAFLASVLVAGVLAAVGLPKTVGAGRTDIRATMRSAWRPAVLRMGLAGFIGWGCLGGLSFLVSFRAQDAFGLSADGRGALLTVFGIAGMVTARPVGQLVDRWGGRRSLAIGMVSGAVLLAGVGVVPNAIVVGALWCLCGVASQFVLVGVNSSVLSGPPGNRGGAVSVVQALRFLGGAATPVVFTPTYHADPLTAFLVPAGLLVAGVPAALIGEKSEGDAE